MLKNRKGSTQKGSPKFGFVMLLNAINELRKYLFFRHFFKNKSRHYLMGIFVQSEFISKLAMCIFFLAINVLILFRKSPFKFNNNYCKQKMWTPTLVTVFNVQPACFQNQVRFQHSFLKKKYIFFFFSFYSVLCITWLYM